MICQNNFSGKLIISLIKMYTLTVNQDTECEIQSWHSNKFSVKINWENLPFFPSFLLQTNMAHPWMTECEKKL